MTYKGETLSKSIKSLCKAGGSIWITLYTKKGLEALKYEIYSISISYIGFRMENNDNTTIAVCRGEHKMSFSMAFLKSCLGKTVFLTREEAEQALKEREKE
jgi:hypothetical protein